jgi:hypothetical protein
VAAGLARGPLAETAGFAGAVEVEPALLGAGAVTDVGATLLGCATLSASGVSELQLNELKLRAARIVASERDIALRASVAC